VGAAGGGGGGGGGEGAGGEGEPEVEGLGDDTADVLNEVDRMGGAEVDALSDSSRVPWDR
jgi:hypothetical protein